MPTPTNPHRPCRVALYTRTRDLAAASSIGQEIRLRQFLLSRPGWYPVAEYHDHGGDSRRTGPALQQAVADAGTGNFDALLVARLDRLGRDMTQIAAVLADLGHAHVAVATADGAVDTTRPTERLMVSVLAATVEYEAVLQTSRDRHGDTHRRRRRARRAAQRHPHECG